MIYTATFWAKTDLKKFSIALTQPNNVSMPTIQILTPPRPIFRALKDDKMSWEEYCDHYAAMLNYNKQKIIQIVSEKYDKFGSVVLCCWEKDAAKCHRSLVGAWLTENGITTEELK